MKVSIHISLGFLVVLGGIICRKIGNTTLEDDAWWGPEDLKGHTNTRIHPFRVNFSHEMIADLKYRLKNHRPFRPPLEGVGFQYGFNSAEMEDWIQYWSEKYPFQERAAFLNQFSQYKTYVQGLEIHYLHVIPKDVPDGVELVPLLMIRGFPGCVREFYEAIPILTRYNEARDYALILIIPSLVGYGFSDAAVRPEFGATEMAVVLRNLMHQLGFNKFYVQGGDWGSITGTNMATLFPDEVLGFHTNFPLSEVKNSILYWISGSVYPPLVVDSAVQDRMYPIGSILKTLITEMGYYHLQATKPDTIGIALSDTPAGLLAYILQLISSGTRRSNVNSTDGGLLNSYKKEALIDILTIFWSTNSVTTAMRLYSETTNTRTVALGVSSTPTNVPTWTIQAKDEIFYQSPFLLRFKFLNLINSTILNTGGHFLALELPEIFSESVFDAITAFRKLNN